MKRLTIPDVRVDDHTTCRTMIDVEAVREHAMDFYWRLKAYEDTGLEPAMCANYKAFEDEAISKGVPFKRIVALMEADRAGRLVVLPCKVGDVVYGFHGEKTILPMVVKWIETYTNGWCIAVQYAQMAPRFYRFSDFGKTVFLTREEAEKALEAMKNG